MGSALVRTPRVLFHHAWLVAHDLMMTLAAHDLMALRGEVFNSIIPHPLAGQLER